MVRYYTELLHRRLLLLQLRVQRRQVRPSEGARKGPSASVAEERVRAMVEPRLLRRKEVVVLTRQQGAASVRRRHEAGERASAVRFRAKERTMKVAKGSPPPRPPKKALKISNGSTACA